jgi:NTP pyrophosphatase (non-canonical NTP hydrolase)
MNDELAKELQRFADEREWEQFHTPKNLAMALSVEASELLEIFQWLTPEQSRSLSPAARQRVSEEVGDVLNYLIRMCDLLELDPFECAWKKLELNRVKYPAEKVRGSAAKYTDYED